MRLDAERKRFRGHARARVDDKGRLKIPVEYLRVLESEYFDDGDREVFVTSLDGERALVYPMRVWLEKERALLDRLEEDETDPDVDDYWFTVNYWGKTASVDRQGRLLLPQELRERSGIDGEAVVIGKLDSLEIRDHGKLRASPPTLDRRTRLAVTRRGRARERDES